MLRLGSALLASFLLGVPRALDSRAFGRPRSVYVQVAPDSPELAAFGEELVRALAAAGASLAARREHATLVVDVHGLWRTVGRTGHATEAVRFTARDTRGTRRLVVQFAPEERPAAARALLRSLEASPASRRLD